MPGVVYVALFLGSCLLALALQTRRGLWLARRRTWITVVIGDGMIVAALMVLLPQDTWITIATCFIVAGVPIIIRSLTNEANDEDEAAETLRR